MFFAVSSVFRMQLNGQSCCGSITRFVLLPLPKYARPILIFNLKRKKLVTNHRAVSLEFVTRVHSGQFKCNLSANLTKKCGSVEMVLTAEYRISIPDEQQ